MASKEDRFTHFDKFVNIHCPVGLEYQSKLMQIYI